MEQPKVSREQHVLAAIRLAEEIAAVSENREDAAWRRVNANAREIADRLTDLFGGLRRARRPR